MIKIEGVSKKYKNIDLFEDLNIIFEPNKKILIVGPNGTGKSVLLKMIVGYSRPDSGKVIADGKMIGKDVDFLLNVGAFINSPDFLNHLTGYENLKMLAKIQNKVSDEKLNSLIREFELEDTIKKKYKTYFLGVKQEMRII